MPHLLLVMDQTGPMTDNTSENVARDGALLVHPSKAYLLRHLPAPACYPRADEDWDPAMQVAGYLSMNTTAESPDPEVNDYILRLHASVETLFGTIDFDMHTVRNYPETGLEFHQDDSTEADLIKMVTCIHNAAIESRSLTFRKPTWTGHTESFNLQIPPDEILVFGESLITDYEHGIPPGPEVGEYRSLVTRFALWNNDD